MSQNKGNNPSLQHKDLRKQHTISHITNQRKIVRSYNYVQLNNYFKQRHNNSVVNI